MTSVTATGEVWLSLSLVEPDGDVLKAEAEVIAQGTPWIGAGWLWQLKRFIVNINLFIKAFIKSIIYTKHNNNK